MDVSDYRVTHPLRPLVSAGALTFALFLLSVLIIERAAPVVSDSAKRPLVIYTSVYLAAWLLGMLGMIVRRPAPKELVRFWSRGAVAIILGGQFACIWLTWSIMPLLPVEAQLLTAIPIIGCIPTQVIASPESSLANRFGTVAMLGSLALFFATRHTSEGMLAAAYIGGFAAVMFVLADRVAATFQATVAARLASEEAAATLERLLAAVAAERDAKTRFIAAASHDLGQPLQAAALFFDQSLRAPDETGRLRAAEGVRRALAAAEQLLSHMLGHLRLEADAVEPHLSRLRARSVVQRVAAQFEPMAAGAGVVVSVARSNPALFLDPVLIERALGNLLHNSLVHSRGTRVVIGARRKAGRVRLWVIDNGQGIGRSDARHVFDDFFQGTPPVGAVRSGFGLGLSSVRRIASIMNGLAGLDDRWRGGAAFYLDFPAADVRSPAVHRTPAT